MGLHPLALRPYLSRLARHRCKSVHQIHTVVRSMETDNGTCAAPAVSERVLATDNPCIVKTKAMAAGVEGVTSLAQGVVHWLPPEEALRAATEAVAQSQTSGYGPAQGLPALREALVAKIASENGLDGYNVMVTAGANQAFVNVVLSLTDACDTVVLFKPYYFNHLMAFQMTGAAERVVLGDSDPKTLKPDLNWLQSLMQSATPPKMVVIVNPCNPSGTLMTKEEVLEAQAICARGGAWLIMDNTYEHFVYDGASHFSANAANVINIFSFSKAYGMMGWRVGYIAYPDYDGSDSLGAQILKVQDTIPICAPQISQLLALEALRLGRGWVEERVASLAANRAAALDALSVLGPGSLKGGEAAIYLFAKLPEGIEDDERVVEWLIKKHKVTTIMGSSCGCPGHIRVAYANCTLEDCQIACARLKSGLQELVDGGMTVVHEFFESH